ncbi:MAG TPA: FHA domain-containing protein [Vicinamibacteria bacterium]|nr:FHA domain-containing protein [Vicinamibacteria bacterium]
MGLHFADFLFDREARELRRGREAVPLSPKAFQLLVLLLDNRPNPLSQQRLRDALWPEAHVGYTSLAQVVAELRRSLGDSARTPRFVRTVSRFGYAFSGEVVDEERRGFEPTAIRGAFLAEKREYLVPGGETLVGRGEECGLRLPSTGVSRVHARIRADEKGVWVSDEGSKNGTWVNGERREGPTRLRDGDEVVFGTFRTVFRPVTPGGSTRTGIPTAASGTRQSPAR